MYHQMILTYIEYEFKEEWFKEWLTTLGLALLIGWIRCQFGKTDNSRLYKPRKAINVVDTIYYIDSMYKVKIIIDTVIELQNDY